MGAVRPGARIRSALVLDLQSRKAKHGPGWHHPGAKVGPRGLSSTSELHHKKGDYSGSAGWRKEHFEANR